MNGLSTEIHITGDKELMRKLNNLGPALTEFTDAFNKIGKDFESYFSGQVFESQGGVFGTPWKQLSASTQAFKEKHFRSYDTFPLVATGTMRHSFTHDATPISLTVKNTAPYFKYHQSTAPRQKLPRRPMFAINSKIKSIVRTRFLEAINGKLAGL